MRCTLCAGRELSKPRSFAVAVLGGRSGDLADIAPLWADCPKPASFAGAKLGRRDVTGLSGSVRPFRPGALSLSVLRQRGI